jgi:hypothetical protein
LLLQPADIDRTRHKLNTAFPGSDGSFVVRQATGQPSAVAERPAKSKQSIDYDGTHIRDNIRTYRPSIIRVDREIAKYSHNFNREVVYRLMKAWLHGSPPPNSSLNHAHPTIIQQSLNSLSCPPGEEEEEEEAKEKKKKRRKEERGKKKIFYYLLS